VPQRGRKAFVALLRDLLDTRDYVFAFVHSSAVVAGAAAEGVPRAVFRSEGVVARVSVEEVETAATVDFVVAGAADDDVAAAAAAGNDIVAAEATDDVGLRGAAEDVVTGRAYNDVRQTALFPNRSCRGGPGAKDTGGTA